jgi:hypothetical protein
MSGWMSCTKYVEQHHPKHARIVRAIMDGTVKRRRRSRADRDARYGIALVHL